MFPSCMVLLYFNRCPCLATQNEENHKQVQTVSRASLRKPRQRPPAEVHTFP